MKNINPKQQTVPLGAASEDLLLKLNTQEDRVRLTITNNTGGDVRLRKGRGVSAGVGILLKADGILIDEPITIWNYGRAESYMYQGAWYAYSVAGGDVDVDEEIF